MKVLIADRIAAEGIEALRAHAEVDVKVGLSRDELVSVIGDYDALMVRSDTKVTREVIEAGTKLQAIGRAGVGVDNIDVEAATSRGVVVVNAPTGNTSLLPNTPSPCCWPCGTEPALMCWFSFPG